MKDSKNWHKYAWVLGATMSGMLVAGLISQFWLNPSIRNEPELNKSASKVVSNKPISIGNEAAVGEMGANELAVEELAKIENYVRQESKNLDIAKSPAREKQIEMTAMARQLTEAQSTQLSLVLNDLTRPVNERIFSAYLLSLSPASFAQSELNAFASQDLPNFGPVTPHSEAEIRRNQELALRFMAIDRLAELARDPTASKAAREEALNHVRSHATQNPTEQIRRYAQSTLDELSKLSE